jgi:hypothetical protein
MADSGNKCGFTQEQYNRYKNDGFTDEEIEQIWEDRNTMLELYSNKAEREITSSTYIRSHKALNKQVESWLGIKKG